MSIIAIVINSLVDIINYKGKTYPGHESSGFASQFAFPYAKKFCEGVGYDIGCNRIEWSLKGSIPIDLVFNNGYDAYNLPDEKVDYIFSSHCLEHLPDWVKALDYWSQKVKYGGIIFLYLPNYSQEYWRPWNNRKHIHIFTPTILKDYFEDRGFINIFHSEKDLNDSFMIVAEKNS